MVLMIFVSLLGPRQRLSLMVSLLISHSHRGLLMIRSGIEISGEMSTARGPHGYRGIWAAKPKWHNIPGFITQVTSIALQLTFQGGMAAAKNRKGNGKSGRNRRVPRPLVNQCVVRRAYSYGNVPYPGAADGGIQVGVTPTAVLDWSSFSSTWKRFRVMSATLHIVMNGQNDATPGFPTAIVYHDVVSSGAPATILDAYVQKGRRILSFGSSKVHHSFTFKPIPWTDPSFALTIPGQQYWLPVGGSAPLTSAALWLQNYNSTTSSPGLNITVELLLHFDSPQ